MEEERGRGWMKRCKCGRERGGGKDGGRRRMERRQIRDKAGGEMTRGVVKKKKKEREMEEEKGESEKDLQQEIV